MALIFLDCEKYHVGDLRCGPWSDLSGCEKHQPANANSLAERHRDLVAKQSINLAECQIAGVAGPDGLRLAWVSASLTIIERPHHRQGRPSTDMISTIKPRSVRSQTRQGRRLHQTEAGSIRTEVWTKPDVTESNHPGSGSNRTEVWAKPDISGPDPPRSEYNRTQVWVEQDRGLGQTGS